MSEKTSHNLFSLKIFLNANIHPLLSIKMGQRVALLGLNGAGKSTFIRDLIGESSLTPYQFYYSTHSNNNQQNYINLQPSNGLFKKMMGYQSDTMLALKDLSVLQYLQICAEFKNVSFLSIQPKIIHLSQLLNIKPLLHTQLIHLSKGNMQKIAILQVFLNQPQFLFFDEPCQSLDPVEQRRFNSILEKLKNFSLCLFSTHQIQDALDFSHSIILFHRSKIVYFYEKKEKSDFLLFSSLKKTDLNHYFKSFDLNHIHLGGGLIKLKNDSFSLRKHDIPFHQRVLNFKTKYIHFFEFCLLEEEALMPLLLLLDEQRWIPSIFSAKESI
jgi:ABC-2 type transport system ATP-binding protein